MNAIPFFNSATQLMVRWTRTKTPNHNTAVGLSILKMLAGS